MAELEHGFPVARTQPYSGVVVLLAGPKAVLRLHVHYLGSLTIFGVIKNVLSILTLAFYLRGGCYKVAAADACVAGLCHGVCRLRLVPLI